jgi:beta-fructofuranosidase
MASVEAAAEVAAADPRRPRYHFRPPANWMNDPNGTIYHNGYYHLFYQHNPYGDNWGHIHWGHARSRDLVHWEHLPIALWPSQEMGEEHVFSGCASVNGDGVPMLFYTSVGPGDHAHRPPNGQWAVLGDADWLAWQKHPANPILSLDTHGGPAFEGDWRDPYIFTADGRTFLVLGAVFEATAAVALYEAAHPSLADWVYRKLLYTEPRRQTRFCECPNFFQVGDTWVLLTSPYRPVEYVTGAFDAASLTFTPQTRGVLDPGYNDLAPANYYATNTLYAPDGRCILLGWVRGFAPGRGWNGCLALPRVLTIGSDGHPRQTPHPELDTLHAAHRAAGPGTVAHSHTIDTLGHPSVHLRAVLDPGDSAQCGLMLAAHDRTERSIEILFTRTTLVVDGVPAPFALAQDEPLTLDLYLDGAVLELFANHGRHAVTRAADLPLGGSDVTIFARSGAAHLHVYDRWDMGSVW